jgi:hypothetical protein
MPNCKSCAHYAIWKTDCGKDPDRAAECKAKNLKYWKQGKEPHPNPGEVLRAKGFANHHVDTEGRAVYVMGLYELGKALGKNWSPLAESAEWEGWKFIEAGRKESE